MDDEELSSKQVMLPERHSQHDLFICDVSDAVLKNIVQDMEHPLFSLTKKPDLTIRNYRNGNNWLTVTPSVKGMANIYDKDILIYCISQLIGKSNRGEEIHKRVKINSYDLLVFTNRHTGGREYKSLIDALDRLEGTRVRTNIVTGTEETSTSFGLIDAAQTKRSLGADGRLISCEIVLSDWVFNAVKSQEVLTLHRDYFRLRKPLERRIYEIARKHCGQQKSWRISIEKLLEKTGSNSNLKRFKQSVKDIIHTNHLPDYNMSLADNDVVIFINKETMPKAIDVIDPVRIPPLDPEIYDLVRNYAEGWDIRYIEQEWRNWATEVPKSPEMAFLGFVKSWVAKRGPA